MEVDGPEPGTKLKADGAAPAPPRPAATVILLRGGDGALELLLVRRSPQARFMAGVWVFPGGSVETADGRDADLAHRVAAARELAEEASIEVDPDALVAFSRWITPADVSTRFDTRFYVASAPPGARAVVDGSECVDAAWFEPARALAAHRAGEILLVFPTIKHLEQLGAFTTADAVLAHARASRVEPVRPRVIVSGETARIALPGEPGYD